MRHIAVVEDEADLAENCRAALERQGFKVSTYADRPSALAAFQARLPDLAIIDVGLGAEYEGGFDLCRELRSLSSSVPIIFLTARDSDFDVVSGLRLGADDYLTKDISQPHMLARVNALFRRIDALANASQIKSELIERGKLVLDMDRMSASWAGVTLELTVTELWILQALVKHPGHVKSRQQLMDAANVVLDDNTITSHIKRLRKKFMQVDAAFDCIKTAYGMGYRWDA
ncbi:proteobacterial dedicated sortase system response regulator [Simiduia sp. 21SJ11W-1]|uniref:proteobacterial dedicated sortase system response regulator n=1 Tax=Simiduia sp. 21SJ11W-1 TaxID=2909669 RepID=UPI00209DC241|nr:proteobacterial dedicated sortase system response regulator [Simiduia sp. 21SJ11W-1]UTA49088.1 proteobacterial dedicated sortase system response regulator [Simiduia sp. 21SJ11W-1]